MDGPSGQLDAVIGLCGRLDIEVRLEHLGGGGGGLCTLRGRRVLFMDLDADAATRLDGCLAALATVPEVDSMYVAPRLREGIEKKRAG